MRLEETDSEEERLRLLLELGERLDGEVCEFAIGVAIIGHIGGFKGRAFAFALAFVHVVLPAIRAEHGGHGPRLRVFFAFVTAEDFAEAHGVVVVVFEKLRQRDEVWMRGAEEIAIVPHAGDVGQATGKDGGSRWPADGLMAIRAIEEPRRLREAVDVWRLHQRIAIAAEGGAQIVHHDEEDVGALLCGRGRSTEEWGQENEYKKGNQIGQGRESQRHSSVPILLSKRISVHESSRLSCGVKVRLHYSTSFFFFFFVGFTDGS